jgi:uncharacterized protein (TIGR02099 family)
MAESFIKVNLVLTFNLTVLMTKIFRAIVVFLFVGMCCLYLVTRYLLWPQLPTLKPRIEQFVTTQTQKPFSIERIQTSWDRFMPSAQFFNVQLGDSLRLGQVDATLSFRSIASGKPEFATIRLIKPQIDIVRTGERVLQVAGFTIDLNGPSDDQQGLAWLLSQRRIEVIDGAVSWHDQFSKLNKTDAKAVNFVTENRGRSHKFSVNGQLPADQLTVQSNGRSSIDVRADFTRPIGSPAVKINSWQGETYLAAKSLGWAQVMPHLGAWLSAEQAQKIAILKTATVNAQLWLNIRQKNPDGIDGLINVEANQVQIGLKDEKKALDPLNLQRVYLTTALRSQSGQIELNDLEWSMVQDKDMQIASNEAGRLTIGANGVPNMGRVSLKPFNVEDFLPLLSRFPMDASQRAAILARQPKGLVKSTKFDWEVANAQPKSLRWNVNVEFSQAAVKSGRAHDDRLGVPGFTGLSGKISANQATGTLELVGQQSVLTVPNLFDDETVDFKNLTSTLKWTVGDGKTTSTPLIKVVVDQLTFANADMQGKLSGTYQTGGKGVGIVDLSGEIGSGNLLKAYRYMPKRIGERLRFWVRDAVREGQVEQVNFAIKGDLWDFPYRVAVDGSSTGVFKVVSKLRGVTLAYSPEWPELRNLTGDFILNGPGLDIAMRSGTIYDVKFNRVQAQIKDFADSPLTINGTGLGPAQDMVKFVNASPITSRIDNFASATEVSGDAALDLKLVLPLGDLSKTQVDVAIALTRNNVKVDDSLPRFQNVSGQLTFNDAGFSLNNMSGDFLGGPIKVNATPKGPGRLLISAEGQMSDTSLRQLTDNPLTQRLSGLANYTALIDVNGKLSTLEVRSDLVGLTSNLPIPFAKQASTVTPLVIKTVPNPIGPGQERSMGDVLNMSVGDDIAVSFERRRDPKTLSMEIFRGSFGVRADPVIPDTGFAVVANTDRVDLDQWMPILASMREDQTTSRGSADKSGNQTPAPAAVTASFAEGFSLLPSLVSIAAAEVKSGGREVKNVVVGASRVEGFWRANISAQDISGYFTWRDSAPGQGNVGANFGALTARFNRLKIPKSRAADVETLLDSRPGDLPGLDISAEEFVFDETNFGQLSLKAQNSVEAGSTVWTIKELKIENKFAKLSATGQWAAQAQGPAPAGVDPARRKTDLNFDLNIADSGGLLNLFGVKEAVRAAPGVISGQINWLGSPLAIDYPTLSGELKIALEKGQFLKVDPGAAKLIGVLNLQSLPKRLVFDFSDMVSEGFTFDRVNGSAKISKGIARSEGLDIRGVQARIKIDGTADIALETQDLQILVTPELNAGLASLAYTAVNPAIGLGTLLAQTVFRKPLQDAFSYELAVKGSWIDPKVEQKKKTPFVRREEENLNQ